MSDFFVNMISSLSGAFVGAGSAFLLESSHRRRIEKQKHIEATNVALHVLLEYYSELDTYRKKVLSPMFENKENFLPPTSPFAISRQTIDFGSFAFIAASQHSGVIHELLTSVRKFEQLANSTELYSHIHVNELQPKMEEHGVAGGSVGTRDQAVTVAGESLMTRLEALNQYIVENLDDTLLSLNKSMKDLRRVVGCKYKNAEFISKLEEPGDS